MASPYTREYLRLLRFGLATGASPRQALDFASGQDSVPEWRPLESIGDLPPMSRDVPELAPEPIPEGFGQVPVPGPISIPRTIYGGTPLPTGPIGTIIRNPVPLNEGEQVPTFTEETVPLTAVWECCGRLYGF